MSEHALPLCGTQPKRDIHILLQSEPLEPNAHLQWSMEVIAYAVMAGNDALDKGATYHPVTPPSWGHVTTLYRRFLDRVEAATVYEERTAAE